MSVLFRWIVLLQLISQEPTRAVGIQMYNLTHSTLAIGQNYHAFSFYYIPSEKMHEQNPNELSKK